MAHLRLRAVMGMESPNSRPSWADDSWQSPITVPARSWMFLVLSGLGTGASWICYFHALKLGDTARVAPIDKLSMPVASFGGVFLGERLTLMNWIGVALIAT